MTELLLAGGDVALCSNAGVELDFEVGVPVGEHMALDVGLDREGNDGERAVRA